MRVGSKLQFEFPDNCPDNCSLRTDGFYQGCTCSRCPVLNCSGDDDLCLIQSDNYRDDWAIEWVEFFKSGKLPELPLAFPKSNCDNCPDKTKECINTICERDGEPEISFQTWICPDCFDDHFKGDDKTCIRNLKKNNDDLKKSTIKLVEEKAEMKVELEKLHDTISGCENCGLNV